MTMYFSRIELNRGLVRVRDLVGIFGGDGYKVHRHIWSFFADGADSRRDFLYRQETAQGRPRFYTVSERPPVDASGLWTVLGKPYQPRLITGQRLMFSLRVNPVRTKRDAENRQHRHDVVMEAKKRQLEKGGDKPPVSLSQIIQEEGCAWLTARAEKYGFTVELHTLRVDGYQQHVLYKKQGRITFSTLDFNGILGVTDPGLFRATLFHGIGPAKGFGCGLMMVKRP